MMELSYRRHRFPPVVIQHAVWLYLRFTLSYRDVEDLLAERGLDISYESVRSWVLKFGPVIARQFVDAAPDIPPSGCIGSNVLVPGRSRRSGIVNGYQMPARHLAVRRALKAGV